MVRAQPIDTLDLPELAPFRTLKWKSDMRQQGIFVAEGEKVVRRLIESDVEIISLLLPERWLKEYEPLLARRKENITAYTAEKAVLEKLVGFSMYQGVHAAGRVPAPITVQDALTRFPRPLLLMAMDELATDQNVGSLVRNCAAFGAHALVVGETSCSPYMRRAVRASMGTIFRLPVIETESLAGTLEELRRHSVRCIAAHPHAHQRTLGHADLTNDTCIVLGGEGHGIRPEVLAACGEAVLIPMRNGVDSLNVGTAGALFLYEAVRQREAIGRAGPV